jgi:hypothetical protein
MRYKDNDMVKTKTVSPFDRNMRVSFPRPQVSTSSTAVYGIAGAVIAGKSLAFAGHPVHRKACGRREPRVFLGAAMSSAVASAKSSSHGLQEQDTFLADFPLDRWKFSIGSERSAF